MSSCVILLSTKLVIFKCSKSFNALSNINRKIHTVEMGVNLPSDLIRGKSKANAFFRYNNKGKGVSIKNPNNTLPLDATISEDFMAAEGQ